MSTDGHPDPPREGPRSPVFVERRTYRRRRMADAAGLLPILGVALLAIPLLWKGQAGAPARTTDVMLYIFGVWALLAGLSAMVSRDLGRDRAADASEPGNENRPPEDS